MCFCAKDNIHTNRNDNYHIKSLFEFIPTDDEIESMNQKIKKRKERYKELIQMLNEWQIKIYNKIEELKNNLKYEIELMEKCFITINIF